MTSANPVREKPTKGDENDEYINQPNRDGKKKPSHIAYHVRDSKNGGKAFWTRIGTAWQHTDGQGFNVQIDTIPLSGRIGLRVVSEKAE